MIRAHHACLITQAELSLTRALVLYGDVDQFETRVQQYQTLGIDDVRNLIDTAARRPLQGQVQLLVVVCHTITMEAEQALLKVLEEPPASTRFLFVVPRGVQLLPTVLSRFFVISEPESEESSGVSVPDPLFMTFLQASYQERLDLIAKRLLKKDTEWVAALGKGLLQYVATLDRHTHSQSQVKAYATVLTYLTKRGAANKMLLEELALVLPVTR